MTKRNLFYIPHRDSPGAQKKARRQWDFLCGLTGIIIVVTVFSCFNHPFELSQSNAHGFSLWFLLFCAYPFLWLISVFNAIIGIDGAELIKSIIDNGYHAIALGIVDFSALLVIWLLVRFWFMRAFGVKWVRICSGLVMAYAGWGIFQLSLYLMLLLWNNSGFKSLHSYSKESEPPSVIKNTLSETSGKIESQHQIVKLEQTQ